MYLAAVDPSAVTLVRAHRCAPWVPRSPTRLRMLPPVPPSAVPDERPNASPPALVAGVLPVTRWSRDSARCIRHLTHASPGLSVRSLAGCVEVSSCVRLRPSADELAMLESGHPCRHNHHHWTRHSRSSRTRPKTRRTVPCRCFPATSRAAPPCFASPASFQRRPPTWVGGPQPWVTASGPWGPR